MRPDNLWRRATSTLDKPSKRGREIAEHAGMILRDEEFADKFYDNLAKGWYSLVLSVGELRQEQGLPISCFGTQLQDDTFDILRGAAEVGAMSKVGGGTATYFNPTFVLVELRLAAVVRPTDQYL